MLVNEKIPQNVIDSKQLEVRKFLTRGKYKIAIGNDYETDA